MSDVATAPADATTATDTPADAAPDTATATDPAATAPRTPLGAPAPPRRQLVATGFAVAAGAMMIGSLLAFYLARRHASGIDPGNEWLGGHAIPNPQLDYALITLLGSAVTAHWALWSSRRRETGHAWLAMAVTLVLGFGFLNMAIYSLNRIDLEIGSSEWANLAFATTGLALALVIVGMFYLGLMTLRSLGGSVGPAGSTPLGSAVFFWDFVVLAWVATWYIVYVVK